MAKAKSKAGNIFVWIIIGLLVVGLAGFGLEGFGGQVRGVGQVGDRDIMARDYFNQLQAEIRTVQQETGQPYTFAQAQAEGLDRQVLSRLVLLATLENETMQLGMSVGDELVRDELLSISQFRAFDGGFNREAYRFYLQNEGMTETEFEDQIRMDLSRSILQVAVISGMAAPQVSVDTLVNYIGEQRDFRVLRFEEEMLSDAVPEPGEAQLRAYYDENPNEFTLPEARRISFAWVVPSMLIDTVEVSEDAVRALYDARIDEFVRPERRLVERLIFDDAESAQEGMNRITAGDADFVDLVTERGFDLDDVDMGDVTQTQLGAAGAEVFAMEAPGVVGPIDTQFGPALFRMNAVLQAQETPFEEVASGLRAELADDRARRVIADQFDDFEDLLAGGLALEDVAAATVLEFGEIVMRPGDTGGIANYQEFREAAALASPDAFPQIRTLPDGGVFALQLDEVLPPELQPFEEVADQVAQGWRVAERERRMTAQAEDLLAALRDGTEYAELGLEPDPVLSMGRQGFLLDYPRELIAYAFTMEEGGHDRFVWDGAVYLVSLDAIRPPDPEAQDTATMRENIADQLRESIAFDLFDYYARRLQADADIRIDEAALQAVHQNF